MSGWQKMYAPKADEVTELYGKLSHEGVSDYEILDYFFARLATDQTIDILKDFADICGIEVSEQDHLARRYGERVSDE